MADLDTFLQEYADWANAKPMNSIAVIRLAISFPFLTQDSSANDYILCDAEWGTRGRFEGSAGIFDQAEYEIGDLWVAITPPITATISNYPITVGSTISFKLRNYQPKWEKALIFKPTTCQPPDLHGRVEIDNERQSGAIRIVQREYAHRHV